MISRSFAELGSCNKTLIVELEGIKCDVGELAALLRSLLLIPSGRGRSETPERRGSAFFQGNL